MEDPSYTQREDHNCTQQEAHSGFLHLEKALLILQGVEIGNCPVQRDTLLLMQDVTPLQLFLEIGSVTWASYNTR